MKVTVLGGGNEIGASCILVELDGRRFLVDAGIRMGTTRDGGVPAGALPQLTGLSETNLDAVFVTHAHLDHSGALPVVHRLCPSTPVYVTAPTCRLLQVLLADALRLMQISCEREHDIPLYDAVLVEHMFTRIIPKPFGSTFNTAASGIEACFFPAGHILGAACVLLAGNEGSILITGDISVDDQRTIPGMVVGGFKPDVVVMESTYGNCLHASREAEEKRLGRAVADIIGNGGHALVPAFALGRSQEIILILQHYLDIGLIPDCILWVDGMIRSICKVYASYASYLQPTLKSSVDRLGNPFYGNGVSCPVTSGRQRKRILEGPPAIIVSSSGMLAGGPSQYYASQLAEQREAGILLTGYQDEESPGKHLLDLVNEGGGTLGLGQNTVDVQCHVDMYGLSAHADSGQLVGIATTLEPSDLILVHGDDGARSDLAAILPVDNVHLPENGDEVIIAGSRHSRRKHVTARSVGGLGRGKDISTTTLQHLWKSCLSGGEFTLDELTVIWYGPGPDPGQIEHMFRMLEQDDTYFEGKQKPSYVYKARSEAAVRKLIQQKKLMVNLRDIEGSLILVKTTTGIQPAVCYEVNATGFKAFKVSTSTTEHMPEDFIDLIGPWDLKHPVDPWRERTKLHRLEQQSLILKGSLQAADLWDELQLDGMKYRTVTETLSAVHQEAGNTAARLAIGLILAGHPEYFTRRVDSLPDIISYAPLPLDMCPDENTNQNKVKPLEPETALTVADQILPSESGLCRCTADCNAHKLLLYFHQPDIARHKYQQQLAELEVVTGWSVEVRAE